MRLLIFILTLITFDIQAQLDNLLGRWTNGLEFYESEKINETTILFSGGNLHEGGSVFTVSLTKDNSFTISGHLPNDDFPPSIGNKNDLVFHQTIDNNRLLVVKSNEGEIIDLLRELGENESFEGLIISNKTNFELAGKYKDLKSQKEVIFHPNKQISTGLSDSKDYQFEFEYDMPVNLIKFSNGDSFYYEIYEDGLKIFKVQNDKHGDKEKGERIFNLEKIEWLSPVENKDLRGRYPFASTTILIDDILVTYT